MVKQNTDRRGVSILWDVAPGDEDKQVTVYATGAGGDVHNKVAQKNSGEAGVFFPFDFSGSSNIEIRDADGNVLDSGTLNL
jgi:hypothetical protein